MTTTNQVSQLISYHRGMAAKSYLDPVERRKSLETADALELLLSTTQGVLRMLQGHDRLRELLETYDEFRELMQALVEEP